MYRTKQPIRLTESQLRQVVNESVKRILNEQQISFSQLSDALDDVRQQYLGEISYSANQRNDNATIALCNRIDKYILKAIKICCNQDKPLEFADEEF